LAITRTLKVNVLTPEAVRTVVAIGPFGERLYRSTTVFTDERFLAGDECHSVLE
jgi:hypothetical protein